jgi:hypothetical protein
MKIIPAIESSVTFGLILATLQVAVGAPLEIVTNEVPQPVFFGAPAKVFVAFHNPGDRNFADEIRTRIIQTTSATAVLLSDSPWQRLQVPANETILASATLDFPPVKSETKFLVQWLENTNRVIGKTEVLVYPTNLLAEMKPFAGDETLGVFDPQNELKPLLKNLKLPFTDLENADLELFSGKLAIVGPFQSKTQMRDGLANQLRALAKSGVAIVWLQPPRSRGEKLAPSFYSVAENTNALVVVQPELVSNLSKNPQSQLNLIYFCQLAMQPDTGRLPDSIMQP